MPKSKKKRAAQDVELAEVWSDPHVEEMGSAVRSISNKAYLQELANLQVELVKLQEWIRTEGLKVAIVFEGRDAAGKGGAIKTVTLSLNPRYARVVALAAPTEREKSQWYFQRYVAHLPAAGEMVLFDRSWYNRAGVERVMGFCTDDEYREFLRSCPEFERMLVRSGIMVIKYWFSVSDAEQERRFQGRIEDPRRKLMISDRGRPEARRPRSSRRAPSPRSGRRATATATGLGTGRWSPAPSKIMLPRLGSGGWTPSPRKLSVASSRIASATPNVASTVSGPKMFGSTWRTRIDRSDTPTTRAAITYSASRSASTWPRRIRAVGGQPSRPITAITDSSDGPTTDTKTMISSSVGIDMTMSVKRISSWSIEIFSETRRRVPGTPNSTPTGTRPENPAIRPIVSPIAT